MPTYEYRCRDCGVHLEVVQSFRDQTLTECGNCGGRLRKVFAAAGIIFKGSGYYVNDSRKAAEAKAGNSKNDQPTTSGSKEPAAEKGKKQDGASTPAAPATPATGGNSSSTAESA